MTTSADSFSDLDAKVAAGQSLTTADAARLLASTDLIAIGVLGDAARRQRRGNRVTYGVVLTWSGADIPADVDNAGEARIANAPSSAEDAVRMVQAVAGRHPAPLTGFSTADLLTLMAGDHLALADLARELAAAGLAAVADTPIDRLGDTENAIEVIRALRHGGLGVWRLTVDRAPLDDRLALAVRAAEIQQSAGGVHAFAPLPRLDPPETPSTGYDDVRTIAVARLVCGDVPSIQVDWQLYGPKLAQVAIAYGADDIDNVSAIDTLKLGHRRSPREDIARQIQAAFAEPAERDGRFVVRS